MRILELFSGTKSIGKAFERLGNEVVSVDNSQIFNPTHCSDVLQWDYMQYPPGHFDVVHASPPCTQYSACRTTGPPRDLEGADALVLRALEIIQYFAPRWWTMENPASGLLKTRPCVQHLAKPLMCSYCMYGNFGYRKNTHIWTNLDLKLKTCDKTCHGYSNGRHPNYAQKGCKKTQSTNNLRHELYRIPDSLCDEIAEACMINS